MPVPFIFTILLVSLCTWVIFITILHVQAALISPLRRVPGPWYASVSDIWLIAQFLRFRQAQAIHELFQRYGPIVRIGPRKVVFCDLDSLRSVYLIQRFDKSPLYKHFAMEGVDHSLTLLDNASHTARRKSVGPHYTATSIVEMQPTIQKCTMQIIELLHVIRGEMALDCLDLLRTLMLDITAFTTFGYNLGAVDKWTLNKPSRLCVATTDFTKVALLGSVCPEWVWKVICHVPHPRIAGFTNAIPFLKEFVSARVQEAQAEIDDGQEFGSLPLIHRLLKHRSSSPTEQLSSQEVVAEAASHLCRRSFRLKIDTAMPDAGVIPDLSALQELPYLAAFIQEGLRVYTVIPSLLERVVPPTGNFQLMGYDLPPGTIVGTQAWSMHKSPTVFPDPEHFSPQRWLDDAEPARSLRLAHLMPFGAGSRACVGQQLAHAMLRIVLVGIVRNFNIEADPSTTPASMSTKLAGFPASGRCKLILTPRGY
ncbi:cytochrome P450 [Mycena rebaudengoi]|nr:cytochrome P450 [Mycena rebaudengoi]